jgi:hypothetical protein
MNAVRESVPDVNIYASFRKAQRDAPALTIDQHVKDRIEARHQAGLERDNRAKTILSLIGHTPFTDDEWLTALDQLQGHAIERWGSKCDVAFSLGQAIDFVKEEQADEAERLAR